MLRLSWLVDTSLGPLPSSSRGLVSHVFLYLRLSSLDLRTPIFIVNATDPDLGAGGSVLYSFQPPSQFFAIDSARGIVTVIRELDYETTQAYQLTVNATVSPCAGGPGGQMSASCPQRGHRMSASFPAGQGL